MMRLAVFSILIGLAWAGATGSLGAANLVLGVLLAALVLAVASGSPRSAGSLARARAAIGLAGIVGANLMRSSVRGALTAFRPSVALRPGVLAYPLRADREHEAIILCVLAAFTPGIVSVRLADDSRTLLVHAFDLDDARGRQAIHAIRRLERQIGRLLQ